MFIHQLLTLCFLSYIFFLHPISAFAGNFLTSHFHFDFLVDSDSPHVSTSTGKLALGFGRPYVIANVVIFVITLLNIIVYKLRELQEENSGQKSIASSSSLASEQQLCRRFLLHEIVSATNNFDNSLVIGKGGFGKVYKGIIDNGSCTVAIKRLNSLSNQGAPEFWTEINMLSKFRHSHLVTLIGYCDDNNEMILVYEYMVRGSLAEHLHKNSKNNNHNNNSDRLNLSWVQRLKICIGAARGLDYLHTGTAVLQRVIHRDVKSSNILLDENWAAKISDFGLSRIGPADQECTHVSTKHIKGTFGYMDPDYFLTRRFTRKTDVYAFGVVLFEVLCERPAVDRSLVDEDQWGLAGWGKQCIDEGASHKLIEPNLKWEILPNSLTEFLQIAVQCLHSRPKKRPTMSEVVAKLELALALQLRTDVLMDEDLFNSYYPFGSQENTDSYTEGNQIVPAGNSSSKQLSPSGVPEALGKPVLCFGGAAIGAVFGEVLALVIRVAKKNYLFKSKLNIIERILISLQPKIDLIAESNKDLKSASEETSMFIEQLEAGKKLIHKCSEIRRWDVYRTYMYSRKLSNFQDSLLWFFRVDVQALLASDMKKTFLGVDQLLSISENGGDEGYCTVPGLPDLIVGFDEPLKELKNMLLKDGVSLVVLSAPVGFGKTTLSKMLCKDKEIQGIYGTNTIFVTVSETPSIKDIFQNIFKHQVGTTPPFQNEEGAMNQIGNLMKRLVVKGGSILLVLDDVWSRCESLIEKFKFRIDSYKILVTSRSVFPGFDHTYKLNSLQHEDAVKLFRHSAFNKGDSSKIPNELVNEIVKGCRGSPLALSVVGRSLNGRPVVCWRNMLKKWSEGQSIFHSYKKDLLLLLKTSLDELDEIALAKDFFLDLGSFPEDIMIPAADLLDMWIELYGDDEGVDALNTLFELSFRNLVNLFPTSYHGTSNIEAVDNDYGNEFYVRQHDLLRDLAIYESSQESIEQRKRLVIKIHANSYPKWWVEQQQQPHRARILSISTDESFASIWYSIQLPSTEVLVLNFCSRDYSLPQFIETMDKLKILIITNRGSCPVVLNNFQILGYLSNVKSIRLEHVSIPSLTTSILQLKNLHKISLVMCEIVQAFANCSNEIPDILPNLTELEIGYCSDLVEFPIGFCNLLRLKKLSLTYCSELIALPDGFGRLANLEMLRIHSCIKLGELPESICGLHMLSFLDISDCVRMSRMPEQIGELRSLKALHMRGCPGLQYLPTSVEELGELKHVICDEEISYLWKYYGNRLTKLKVHVIKEDVNL